MEKEFKTEKSFSPEFQHELLDLVEMCVDNHTDGLTLTFEYTHGSVEVEMTFKVKAKEQGNGNIERFTIKIGLRGNRHAGVD